MLVVLACASAGCASSLFPEDLTRTVNRSLTLAEIKADPQAHLGEHVILGGDIIKAIPKPLDTEIEILARRLGGGDVPEGGDGSTGRFLVRTAGFLDPAIYARGRRLTVLRTGAGTRGPGGGRRRLRVSGDPRGAPQALARGRPVARRRVSAGAPRHADRPLLALAGAYFLTLTDEKVPGSM